MHVPYADHVHVHVRTSFTLTIHILPAVTAYSIYVLQVTCYGGESKMACIRMHA